MTHLTFSCGYISQLKSEQQTTTTNCQITFIIILSWTCETLNEGSSDYSTLIIPKNE